MSLHDTGEAYQGEHHGDDGAADGDDGTTIVLQAEAAHGRVSHQGVGGIHRGDKDRRLPGEGEGITRGEDASNHRQSEREETKDEPGAIVTLEVIHIDLYSSLEHDV